MIGAPALAGQSTIISSLVAASEAGHDMSDRAIGWSLVAAVVLIIANGFFVAYEFALVAAKRSAFEAGAEQGNRTSRASLDAISDLSAQLAGSQLGITMASLGLGYVAEPALAALLERAFDTTLSPSVTSTASFFTALAITVFLHLVVGEMIPKNIAIARPTGTVTWLVMPYRAYNLVFRPIVRLLNGIANSATRALGVEPTDEIAVSHSTAELASIVTESSQGGGIEADSAELLRGALDFAERPIGAIARPLDDWATIRFGATAAHAEHIVKTSGQTRVPIVAPSLGERRLVGYLHAKELLGIDPDRRAQPLPSGLTRQMAVIRDDRPLIEALRILRRLKRQLAVVVSADGPIGIVSVEEVIRALVDDSVERADSQAGSQAGSQGN